MSDDFHDLLRALLDAGARFLIVGAHALAAHGVPRVTGDLDIWVERSEGNARRIWRALAAFGAPLDELDVEESDFTKQDVVVQLGLPPYRIDIMTSISGVSFDEAWPERLEGQLLRLPVPFLGRQAFLQNKRASGRPKDLLDIAALEG